MSPEHHRKTAQKFNTPGHAHLLTFSCYQRLPLLLDDGHCVCLAESIRQACASHAVGLWAYVFMPEHVHLIVKPRRDSYHLGEFAKSVKLSCSKRIINNLLKRNSPLLQNLTVQERSGKWCYRYWQEGGGYDKNMWSLDFVIEKAKYCHANPVRRRLVAAPADWKWSSYRWLEMGKREGEPLVVDEWDESPARNESLDNSTG